MENDIANKIKQLRASRGLTLEQIANIVGVGKSTVRKWETSDIKNMRCDKIDKLAYALGVSPTYLMGWEESDGSNSFIS
ncbi:MAG: helix-turn-helix transcriptional regulator [Eubacteriaceae bacterium]|nr:helix-turn-helix transcriptional regulator [Eubacteriaceae bacterium]